MRIWYASNKTFNFKYTNTRGWIRDLRSYFPVSWRTGSYYKPISCLSAYVRVCALYRSRLWKPCACGHFLKLPSRTCAWSVWLFSEAAIWMKHEVLIQQWGSSGLANVKRIAASIWFFLFLRKPDAALPWLQPAGCGALLFSMALGNCIVGKCPLPGLQRNTRRTMRGLCVPPYLHTGKTLTLEVTITDLNSLWDV